MIKTKKNKIEYEESKPYQKYRRKKNWAISISGLANSILALAIVGIGLTVATSSLKSSGILEDKSQSRIGKLNSVTVSGDN